MSAIARRARSATRTSSSTSGTNSTADALHNIPTITTFDFHLNKSGTINYHLNKSGTINYHLNESGTNPGAPTQA